MKKSFEANFKAATQTRVLNDRKSPFDAVLEKFARWLSVEYAEFGHFDIRPNQSHGSLRHIRAFRAVAEINETSTLFTFFLETGSICEFAWSRSRFNQSFQKN